MEHTALRSPAQRGSAVELLNELRQPILIELSRTLRRSLAGTIDDLLERLLKEGSWQARQAIDEALDLLRHGREGIEQNFDRAIADIWIRHIGGGGAGATAGMQPAGGIRLGTGGFSAGGLGALALVDDSAMGDQLIVGRIAARSRRRMDEEQVDGLRARFAALLERDWFADNDYPIAPDLVFEALKKALSEFGQARVVLFLLEAFEPRISADLSALYGDLNQRLIRAGVLPEIRYQIAKTPGQGGGGAAGAGAPAGRPGGEDSEALVARLRAAVAQQRGGDGAGAGSGSAGAGTGAGGGSGASGASGTSGASSASYAMPESGTPAGARMANDAVSALVTQLDQRIVAAQGSATRYLSDPGRFASPQMQPAPPSDQLMAALTTLQAAPPVAGQAGESPASAAKAASTAVAREHGSPLERLIIETVSLVFEHVYEDEEIADAIKQELLRLQVVAFKAALIDPSFFARPDHPMRQFIDRIAEIGSDPDFDTGADSPLVEDIAALVTWVLASFDCDLSLFETALARIVDIIEAESGRRTERLAKIAVAAHKADELERVRSSVRAGLTAALTDDTPEFVCRFVSEAWTEVVARIESGAEYAPFDSSRARRAVEALLWSIAPKAPTEIPALAAELPQLIADLSRGLSFIALSGAERELFFSELLAWHGATIEDAKRIGRLSAVPAPAPAAASSGPAAARAGVAVPSSGAGQATSLSATRTPVVPAIAKPASSVGVGATERAGTPGRATIEDAVQALGLSNGAEVELTAPNGERKRFKVGWMSPSRSVFIFSRYPRDHWTARRAVLNTLLAQGRIRLVAKVSGTGRAIESLKQR